MLLVRCSLILYLFQKTKPDGITTKSARPAFALLNVEDGFGKDSLQGICVFKHESFNLNSFDIADSQLFVVTLNKG